MIRLPLRLPAPLADRMAAALLFAYPLLLVSVDHWGSGLYHLVVLLALLSLRAPQVPLTREEWIFIGVILLYFAAAVISNTLNGWTYASIRWFEATFRLLLVIPIFLFLRERPDVVLNLLRGVPVAGLLTGAFVVYQTMHHGSRVVGASGPIFAGNMAVLLAMASLVTMRYRTYPPKLRIPLHVLGAVMALAAAVFSGTRGAWLAAIVVLPVVSAMALLDIPSVRARRRLALGALALACAVLVIGVVVQPKLTQHRLAVAMEQTSKYLGAETWDQRDKAGRTSVGTRLEQWRTGLLIFTEHPFFGIGIGNAGYHINRHVAAGTASPSIEVPAALEPSPKHLHSGYVDALAFKGIVGLVTLLCVLFYPVWLSLRRASRGSSARILVVGHALAFAVFAITEDPFIRNGYTSVYVVFLACVLALLFAETRPAAGVPGRDGPQPDAKQPL